MKLSFFLYRFLKKNKNIKQWLNVQSFPNDAILYLIEKEIYENGNRDLSYIIPRYRSDEYFASLGLSSNTKEKTHHYGDLNGGIFGDYAPDVEGNNRNKSIAKNMDKLNTAQSMKPTQTIKNAPMPDIIPINSIFEKSKDESQLYNSHSSSVYLADSEYSDISDVDLSCYDD